MKKLLEVGCGQGFNSYVLAKREDVTIIGIDISPEDIQISNNRYAYLKNNLNFLVMNAEKLKFKNESFDEVYALDVLEHVDNLKRVIDEMDRVLKVGGKFIINIPFYKSEEWLITLRPTYFKEINYIRVFLENDLVKILFNIN